jgi:prephenate dehydratase
MLPRLAGNETRVAYQGSPGAFGEAAVVRAWEGAAVAVPTRTFASVLSLVAESRVEYGVLPLWNTLIGSVRPAWEALDQFETEVTTVGEVSVPVSLCLVGLPGTTLDDVRFVGSHPAALGQCRQFFASRPHVQACAATDTAGAARELAFLVHAAGVANAGEDTPWYSSFAFDGPRELAAVSSRTAAELYGLEVLAEGIQDEARNVTRFSIMQARRAVS